MRNQRNLILSIVVLAGSVVFDLLNVPRLLAQSQPATSAPLPSFEVASIKPHPSESTGRFFIRMGCGPDPGRCTPSNVTAKMLIQTAYNVKDFQVSGGPSWINSERFDIEAKVDDSLAEQLQKL